MHAQRVITNKQRNNFTFFYAMCSLDTKKDKYTI